MRLFLFITVFFTSFFSAQSHKGFRWIDDKFSLFSIDLRTGVLIKETKKDERIELGKIQDWDNIKRELPGDFDINTFHYKNKFLISIPGTGQLYDLDVPNLTLHRLDQTFFRGYNFNANQFIRKDTLFSIGGEGFWQNHSIISFYNSKTMEWDLYRSLNKNPTPSFDKFSGYSKKHDAFFSAFLRNDAIAYGDDILLSIYSFKSKKWSVMGNLNQRIKDTFGRKKYESAWTGEYLILYVNNEALHDVLILDPFNNILYNCNILKEHLFLSISEIYYRNGYLFSRDFVSSGNNEKLVVDSTSIHELINHSSKIGKVYEEQDYTMSIVMGFALMFLAIPGVMLYRKHIKTRNELCFSDLEMVVLKEFICNPIDKKFTTVEINSLLQINGKSYDNQRQIRNRIISSINKNLYSFFDSKEFLCRTANADDKRMMDYFINPEIKQKDLDRLSKHINN